MPCTLLVIIVLYFILHTKVTETVIETMKHYSTLCACSSIIWFMLQYAASIIRTTISFVEVLCVDIIPFH